MKKIIPPSELLELAWNIICNAGEGDWTKESKEWQKAAKAWRTIYFYHKERGNVP